MQWTLFILPAINTAALVSLAVVHWVKDHRLRLDVHAEIEAFRKEIRDAWSTQPPILIGETFLAERLEHIDQVLVETLARVVECERKIGVNGNGVSTPGSE